MPTAHCAFEATAVKDWEEGGFFERSEKKKLKKKMSENIRWQKQGTEAQRSEVDVLYCMSITFAVFHLERSELNLDASENAVEVKAMVDPIQNKSGRRRTKKWGRVRRQNSKEETRNGRTKKCGGRTL